MINVREAFCETFSETFCKAAPSGNTCIYLPHKTETDLFTIFSKNNFFNHFVTNNN